MAAWPSRPIAQKITLPAATTSTGNSTGIARFGVGMSAASIFHVTSGSTKNIAFKAQGTVGQSGIWTDLMAATTGSTAGASINTTVALTFDAIRLNVTGNATTGNTVLYAWILARP